MKDTPEEREKRWQEWQKKRDAASAKSALLNKLRAVPTASGGKVTLDLWVGDNYAKTRKPTGEEFEAFGLDPDNQGCVEAHPEGSDRGGYVPTLTNGCYYDEQDGSWRGA